MRAIEMKRKKRAKKGVISLEKQIKKHQEKLNKAIKSGNWGLEGYYRKEIDAKRKDLEKKKKILGG